MKKVKLIIISLTIGILFQGCINQKVTESEVFNPVKEYELDESFTFKRYFVSNTDTTELEIWYLTKSNAKFNFIYVSGNGGNIRSAVPFFNELGKKADINIFSFNYSGYGLSEGKPTVDGIVNDGKKALDYFNKNLNNNNLPTIILGYSMGGYVVLNIMSEEFIDQGIIMSTFTSMEELEDYLVKDALPWMVRPFLKLDIDEKIYGLNNKLLAQKIEKPILVIHGKADNFIPPSMGKTLYDLIPNGNKKFVEINDADHRMVIKDDEKIKEVIKEILLFTQQNSIIASD
ncbi:MAG: alpha/beta hydrolase [Bacteroidales bacterium]